MRSGSPRDGKAPAGMAMMLALLLGGCAEVQQVGEFLKSAPPPPPVRSEIAEADETPLDRRLAALWNYLSGEEEEEKLAEEDEAATMLDPVRAEAAAIAAILPAAGKPDSLQNTLAEAEPLEPVRAAPAQEALAVNPTGCPSRDELSRFQYESAKRAFRVRSLLAARESGKPVNLTMCR